MFDSETGLYYNWFRYYDSEVGRYLQVENVEHKNCSSCKRLHKYPYLSRLYPMVFSSENITCNMKYSPFSYANNSPLLMVDPKGLKALSLLSLPLYKICQWECDLQVGGLKCMTDFLESVVCSAIWGCCWGGGAQLAFTACFGQAWWMYCWDKCEALPECSECVAEEIESQYGRYPIAPGCK